MMFTVRKLEVGPSTEAGTSLDVSGTSLLKFPGHDYLTSPPSAISILPIVLESIVLEQNSTHEDRVCVSVCVDAPMEGVTDPW
jgi:hypothetical protein